MTLCNSRLPEQKAFTLIEVMVALTLFSLVMVATLSSFRTLSSTQLSVDAVTTRNDELRAVSSFLRDAFESAVLGAGRSRTSAGGAPEQRTVFEAGGDFLVWKTAMRFGESAGGAYVVRVARENNELVLRWQQMDRLGALQPWDAAESRTLVGNLQEFAVAGKIEYGGPWVDGELLSQAPQWVRLRLRASDRFWPDLIMQVAG